MFLKALLPLLVFRLLGTVESTVSLLEKTIWIVNSGQSPHDLLYDLEWSFEYSTPQEKQEAKPATVYLEERGVYSWMNDDVPCAADFDDAIPGSSFCVVVATLGPQDAFRLPREHIPTQWVEGKYRFRFAWRNISSDDEGSKLSVYGYTNLDNEQDGQRGVATQTVVSTAVGEYLSTVSLLERPIPTQQFCKTAYLP